MFFLPQELFIKGDRFYVMFNLSVIPKDMNITLMRLHIPLLDNPDKLPVRIKEIRKKWSEKSLKKGKLPSLASKIYKPQTIYQNKELILDLTQFSTKWRVTSKENFGICIRLKSIDLKSLNNTPPYLIIDTI